MWFWNSKQEETPAKEEETYEDVEIDERVVQVDQEEEASTADSTSTEGSHKKREQFVAAEDVKRADKRVLVGTPNLVDDAYLREKLLTKQEVQALDEVRAKDPELCEPFSDRFLIRFVLCNKLKVDDSITMLKNFINWKQMFKADELDKADALERLTPGTSQWEPGVYTKDGKGAIWVFAKNLKPELMNDLVQYVRSSYYVLDASLDHDVDLMRKGFILCEDLNGYSMSGFLQMYKFRSQDVNSPDLNSAIQLMLKAFPMRFRGFYLVDAPWYCRILIPLFRPLLGAKLGAKIHLIKREELSTIFEKEMIPVDYGGTHEPRWLETLEMLRTTRDDKFSDGRYLDPTVRN